MSHIPRPPTPPTFHSNSWVEELDDDIQVQDQEDDNDSQVEDQDHDTQVEDQEDDHDSQVEDQDHDTQVNPQLQEPSIQVELNPPRRSSRKKKTSTKVEAISLDF